MRSTECTIDNVIRVYVVYIHVAVIMMHLSTKSRGNIILSIDIIENSLWRLPPSWIIMIIEFGTFRRHGCLCLAFCTGFGSKSCIVVRTHICSRPLTMTSCELASDFAFGQVAITAWSFFCVAVLYQMLCKFPSSIKI